MLLTVFSIAQHSICVLNKPFKYQTLVSVHNNFSFARPHDNKMPWHFPLCILGVTVSATYPFSNGNIVQSGWAANQVQRQGQHSGFSGCFPGTPVQYLDIVWWSVTVDF